MGCGDWRRESRSGCQGRQMLVVENYPGSREKKAPTLPSGGISRRSCAQEPPAQFGGERSTWAIYQLCRLFSELASIVDAARNRTRARECAREVPLRPLFLPSRGFSPTPHPSTSIL